MSIWQWFYVKTHNWFFIVMKVKRNKDLRKYMNHHRHKFVCGDNMGNLLHMLLLSANSFFRSYREKTTIMPMMKMTMIILVLIMIMTKILMILMVIKHKIDICISQFSFCKLKYVMVLEVTKIAYIISLLIPQRLSFFVQRLHKKYLLLESHLRSLGAPIY